MQEYLENVTESLKEKHGDKPEFLQAVEGFLPSIEPYLEEHPEIVESNILEILIEPERILTFRVPWQDDQQKWHVNLGYRVQYNSALGPYKGGIRFNPSVNESIVRFLGFEQTFKNALTGLPLGGGKGGSDFDSKGRSDAEIMRFCQSFMTELQKYIGPQMDVPAGDLGVGQREVGYMYGQYKRLNQSDLGVLTGKPILLGGSLGRTEATGYGLIYFVEHQLEKQNKSLADKRLAISGKGNVAIYAAEKAIEKGAQVLAMSDTSGYIYKEEGLDYNILFEIHNQGLSLEKYLDKDSSAVFVEDESLYKANFEYDIALPCATENEIEQEHAVNMIKNQKVKLVAEGANMPSSEEAIHLFKGYDVLFAPAKAANAGGVACSALEMTQNAQGLAWSAEEVDKELQEIMIDISNLCYDTAERYGTRDDLEVGANIAGFQRVAEAMLMQGLV